MTLPHDREVRKLLGHRVIAKLDDQVVTEGTLVGFGQGGDFEILEDDGMIHYCWPMLEITDTCPKGDCRGDRIPG